MCDARPLGRRDQSSTREFRAIDASGARVAVGASGVGELDPEQLAVIARRGGVFACDSSLLMCADTLSAASHAATRCALLYRHATGRLAVPTLYSWKSWCSATLRA
jgi:hypothetical protein